MRMQLSMEHLLDADQEKHVESGSEGGSNNLTPKKRTAAFEDSVEASRPRKQSSACAEQPLIGSKTKGGPQPSEIYPSLVTDFYSLDNSIPPPLPPPREIWDLADPSRDLTDPSETHVRNRSQRYRASKACDTCRRRKNKVRLLGRSIKFKGCYSTQTV
jgi:hypothetical protein